MPKGLSEEDAQKLKEYVKEKEREEKEREKANKYYDSKCPCHYL
jgi:hypothetical protein